MIMSQLVSRLAAVLLLVAVLLAALFFVALPLLSRSQAADAAIAEAAAMLSRLDRIAATRDQLEAQLAAIDERRTGQRYYLSEPTDALAGAALQRRVKATIEDSGGRVRSIQALSAEKRGPFQRVGIRVQLMADIDALHQIVHGLESEPPLLFIESIDIQSRLNRQRTRSGPSDTALVVSLEVSGHLREPAA